MNVEEGGSLRTDKNYRRRGLPEGNPAGGTGGAGLELEAEQTQGELGVSRQVPLCGGDGPCAGKA